MKKIVYTGPEDRIQVRIHRSNFFQVFERWGKPVSVKDEDAAKILQQFGFLEKGFSIQNWIKGNPGKVVEILRIAALGDVLQLVMALTDDPFYNSGLVYFRTQGTYQKMVDYFVKQGKKEKVGLRINFDGLVERDSYDPEAEALHRVDIYRDTLGLYERINQIPKILSQENSGFWKDAPLRLPPDPYVLINYNGSRVDNTIDPNIMVKFIEGLRKSLKGRYLVEVTGNPDFERDKPWTGKLEYPDLFKLSANARAVICTDSGLLWVAHMTQTPVIALLKKPTGFVRIGYTPVGSHWINLKQLMKSETPHAYSGDPEILVESIASIFGK